MCLASLSLSCGRRVFITTRIFCCGTWAYLLHSMWNLNSLAKNPTTPAVEGVDNWTTGPLGKSLFISFYCWVVVYYIVMPQFVSWWKVGLFSGFVINNVLLTCLHAHTYTNTHTHTKITNICPLLEFHLWVYLVYMLAYFVIEDLYLAITGFLNKIIYVKALCNTDWIIFCWSRVDFTDV